VGRHQRHTGGFYCKLLGEQCMQFVIGMLSNMCVLLMVLGAALNMLEGVSGTQVCLTASCWVNSACSLIVAWLKRV
jgi:hypothetical protein